MAKIASIVFGAILVIIGILGFLTSPVLGLFTVSMLSAIIALIAGIALLVFAVKPQAVRTMKIVGVIYIIFAALGFYSGSNVLGIFTVNSAVCWLYAMLGVLIAMFAWSAKSEHVVAHV